MSLIWTPRTRTRQPQGAVRINWANPIALGLKGLVWSGPGYSSPVDLLRPQSVFLLQPGATQGASEKGIALKATSGAYLTNQNTTPNWLISGKYATMLAFTGITTNGNYYLAGLSGNSGQGLIAYNLYGSGNRRVQCYVATIRSLDVGTWDAGVHIRGLVVDESGMNGIDSGRVFGSTAFTPTGFTYDTSFNRVISLLSQAGSIFWQAVWDRPLSEAETMSLEANPWQLFAPHRQIIPYGAAASGLPTLSAPQMTGITSTGGYPRVSYVY